MAAGRDAHALGAQAARLASRGDRSGPRPFASGPLPSILLVYLLAVCAAGLGALAVGHSPFVCDGYLGVRGMASVLLSLGLGIVIWTVTAFATRTMVRRFGWARALYRGLRPAVRDAGDATLLGLAVASALGEELLFRGLLVPAVGVVASSVVFGALHQIGGRARWAWMGWATVMGLLFGTVFAATGSLAGPLVAHLAINHSNLRFLRDAADPVARTGRVKQAVLGGLLRRP
ncbi:MAG: lysostaphin resistance A-like protein [Polyangiaceae bacterium]